MFMKNLVELIGLPAAGTQKGLKRALKGMRSHDPRERALSARAVAWGWPKSRHAAYALFRLLRGDPEADVRMNAAIALGKTSASGRKFAAALLEGCRDNDSRVRFWSITALARLKPAAFGPAGSPLRAALAKVLRAALQEKEARLRARLASVLEVFGTADPVARLNLLQLLLDSEPEVRAHAARTCSRLGARDRCDEEYELLEALTYDSDESARYWSAAALKIKDSRRDVAMKIVKPKVMSIGRGSPDRIVKPQVKIKRVIQPLKRKPRLLGRHRQ